MENQELFRISSDRRIILKRPQILSQINIKEIQLRNDPKNFLHSGSKSFNMRQRYLTSKKIKKNDIKGQINLLSDLIDNYSSSSIKNLFLIQKLKDENDFLIDELNRNIKKNTLFSKTTKETFNDLVGQYEKRGYKIPNLTLDNNLFKKSPLLIESKQDVDDFYKNDINTQGNYIEDLNHFPEKNWNFLKKLKKEVETVNDKTLACRGTKTQKTNIDYYSNKKALTAQKERLNLIKEINNIKDLIMKQEKERDEIEYNYPYTPHHNKDYLYNKKKFKFQIKEILQKNLTKKINNNRNIYSLKLLNTDSQKDNLILKRMKKNKNYNKTSKLFFRNTNKTYKIEGKKIKTLITALNEKSKTKFKLKPKSTNNKILSYTEQLYHKINKKKLTDLQYVEKDIIEYLNKKKYKIKNTDINNFNKDFSERIYDIKLKVKKQGLSNTFQEHLGDYGEDGYRKYEIINNTEKVIEKMDKYFAKHAIDKYFDE